MADTRMKFFFPHNLLVLLSRPSPQIKQTQRKVNECSASSQSSPQGQFPKTVTDSEKTPGIRLMIDELEDFAMGKPQTSADEQTDAISSEEDAETSSAAAAQEREERERHERFEREREEPEREEKERETTRIETEKARLVEREAVERVAADNNLEAFFGTGVTNTSYSDS
ncbi:hypothetical protein AMTR_s00001p00256820 [Amborella trichopoda]|uniref:Uncharacterized protein n=3 Tax=Amborella trichopoda TaxID=13333 RepID=W1NMG5_AMBTC|nr:hypothetical protein AMTR_s00001p00256820 [Amborella trichopoda]